MKHNTNSDTFHLPLSHLNDKGEAEMVDISEKSTSKRMAIAQGFVSMSPQTLATAIQGNAPKGNVIATARIAGIMAAKQTSQIIPLCHPLTLTKCTIDIAEHIEDTQKCGFMVIATVTTSGQTGVEMEALHAVSVTALTIYDMLKAIEKSITIENIRLIEKRGGKSGYYHHDEKSNTQISKPPK